MGGSNRIPPRGGNEIDSAKTRETSRERRGGLSVPETGSRDTAVGKAAERDEARFGGDEVTATMQREFINFQRIAGADGMVPRPAKTSWLEFAGYLRDLNLFGTRVHRIAFQRPGTRFTLGSKPSRDANYRNLSGNTGVKEQEMYDVRDGMLHLRSRVEELGNRGPQFINLFKNSALRPEQAYVEEIDGVLRLGNLSRDPVVWVLQKRGDGLGKEWGRVTVEKPAVLEDGTVIVLGKDPADKPGTPLDPSEQTVLRVERHRDSAKAPYRWNLIEFTQDDPAAFEKMADPGEYLAILLGQSPEWTRWRFKELFQTLKTFGWTADQSKSLMKNMVVLDPQQAEIRLAHVSKLLAMANCIGWSPNRLIEVLFYGPVARRFGFGTLEHLPKFLEDLSGQGFNPDQVAALLERVARFEPSFETGLKQIPDFIREWKTTSGRDARFEELLHFFDRTQLEMSLFRGFLSDVPGGLGVFFRGMLAILPELRERWGMEAKLSARMGLDIFLGTTERGPAERAAPEAWLSQAIDAIPVALEAMFRLNLGLIQARTILQATQREQGAGFARWWQNVYEASQAPNERLRKNLERYLSAEEVDKP